MRMPRQRAPETDPAAYYHCISRVINREWVLGDAEKEELTGLLRRYEDFCGVRLVTFCVMSNHFHALVEVPGAAAFAENTLSDEELVRRVRVAQMSYGAGTLKQELGALRAEGTESATAAAERLRERFLCRMGDVSWFMRLVKQRFTQWHNKRHGRTGTLWEDRFRSVLVQGAGPALAAMAVYIDLNPVRAGIVEDPAGYRWCGYAQAAAGVKAARAGLAVAVQAAWNSCGRAGTCVPQRLLAEYRLELWGRGVESGLAGSPNEAGQNAESIQQGAPMQRGFTREAAQAVIAAGGRLAPWQALRCRVRYFSHGAVLGSREWVDGFFAANRARFGPKREDGARPLRHVTLPGVFSLRDLRLGVIG